MTGDRAENDRRARELADREWSMLVGGELVAARSGARYDTVDPATGTHLAAVPFAGADDVADAVDAALDASAEWRSRTVLERAQLLVALSQKVQARAGDLGLLDAVDGGNPVTAMVGDATVGAMALAASGGTAREVKGFILPGRPGELHYAQREPFGVVGVIVPFNHATMFTLTKIVAPLLMGNTVVLKAPDQVPLAPLLVAELARDVLPAGVLNVVSGDGATTGDALVREPRVKRLALTGSVATGMRIQRAAAEVAVKRISLELGGKNPMVVFADADLDKAVEGAVRGMNFQWTQGQSCNSMSRLFLHESIADDFVDRLVKRVAEIRIGMPVDPTTEMGCLVNEAHRDRVLSYIGGAQEAGATVVAGGRPPQDEELSRGAFVEPTVLDGVTDTMTVATDEIFGPVQSVLRFTEEDEVVARCNATQYGLTSSVWTRDLSRGMRCANAIDAGYVWVNGVMQHFPGLPFGGHKNSGVDCEGGIEEMLTYTEIKSINVFPA